MFSPLTKRAKQSSRNDKTPRNRVAPPDSPATPATQNRNNFISDRPATGTPAPWAPRLSVLARYSILTVTNFPYISTFLSPSIWCIDLSVHGR